MKIYISYKFTGKDKSVLRQNLKKLSSSIESLGHQTFMFHRDVQKWGEVTNIRKEIMPLAYKYLEEADLLFVYIEKYEKSLGQGLEVGFAYAKNKPIVLATTVGEDCDYLMGLYSKLVEFKDLDELVEKISRGEVFFK